MVFNLRRVSAAVFGLCIAMHAAAQSNGMASGGRIFTGLPPGFSGSSAAISSPQSTSSPAPSGFDSFAQSFGDIPIVSAIQGANKKIRSAISDEPVDKNPPRRTITTSELIPQLPVVTKDDRGLSQSRPGRGVRMGLPEADNVMSNINVSRVPLASARPLGVGGNGLQLKDAVRIAVNRHPAITAAMATLSQQGSMIDMYKASYYPQITAGINGSMINAASGGTVSPKSTVAQIQASQVLWDFGKTASKVTQAEANTRRQKAVVLKQIDNIAAQTAEAIVTAHRNQELAKIAKEQVAAIGVVLEMAHLRSRAGISTEADPVQALSRLESARAGYEQIKSQHQQALEKLRTLMGVGIDGEVADALPQTLREVQLDAPLNLDNLPDVLIAEADRASAMAQLEGAKADALPTLSLNVGYNKALLGVNPSTYEPKGSNTTAGLGVSSTVFQGGASIDQQKAAAFAVDSARLQIDVARLNAYDQARGYREQIQGARQRFSVLSKRTQSITRTRELYQEQYKLGTRAILDLLNAEQELSQAKSDEQNVRHDLWQSLVGYINAVGQIRSAYNLYNTTIQGVEILP